MPPLSELVPILTALWVPFFVASLDGTIVATLLSSISSSFNASEQAAWLSSFYLLGVCYSTPIYRRCCPITKRPRSLRPTTRKGSRAGEVRGADEGVVRSAKF
ncbi:hypothetical protein ACQY0O_004355 [Thecaphora frezii]